jgi:hypothetical protein
MDATDYGVVEEDAVQVITYCDMLIENRKLKEDAVNNIIPISYSLFRNEFPISYSLFLTFLLLILRHLISH